MKFNELNLTGDLMRGIEDAGFTDCTPVQEQTFKLVLDERRDATVQSQTGTGKTAAFLISVFEIFERANRENGDVHHAALVVVPTRELAVQVAEEAKLLGKHLHYRIGSVFGGVGYGQQERLLEQGADIIIGTPGRLLDFSSSRKLDLRGFDILVLDEADRMLDMGFLPDVRRIVKALPPAAERMTMLFSATLSERVKHMAWEYMNDPGEIEVAPEHVTVDEITQELYHVTRREKVSLLLGLLEREQPENALIFTNMKRTAVELARRLSHNGFPTEYIMGDLPQQKRLKLIEGIKEGKIRFLVATDVAARGLHIDDLDLVVNFDIPEDFELYVHRIGRTARAGKSGKAITLACERYVYGLEAIESFIGQKIPVVWPDESLFRRDAGAGMDFSDRRERRSTRSGARPNRRSGQPTRGRQVNGRRTSAGGGRPKSQSRADSTGGRRPAERSEKSGERRQPAAPSGAKQAAPDGQMNGKGRPRKNPPAQKSPATQKSPAGASGDAARKPAANAPIEDRLSYYKKKYGEDFEINREKSDETARPRSKGAKPKAAPQAKQRRPQQKQRTTQQKERRPQSQQRQEQKPAASKAKSGAAAPQQQAANDGLMSKLKGLFKRR